MLPTLCLPLASQETRKAGSFGIWLCQPMGFGASISLCQPDWISRPSAAGPTTPRSISTVSRRFCVARCATPPR
jgi:hypothetical protein